MSTASNALCAREDVLAWIVNTEDSDANINLKVDNLINSITKAFETYCGVPFKAASYTEQHDGGDSDILVPRRYPINSITSIWDDINWEFGDDTKLASTSYRIVRSRYVLLKDLTFLDGRANVKITYNAGYSTIPYDLKHACIRECVREYQKLSTKNIGMLGRSAGDTSSSYEPDDFLPLTKSILDKYKRKVIR